MANRFWYTKLQSLLCGRTDISGSFCPDGASVVQRNDARRALRPTGAGYTVAHGVGLGRFVVTFPDAYVRLISATATIQLATAADTYVQVGTYNPVTRTIELVVLTGGVPADIAADANNRVHFQFTFSVSTVDQ